ncbi:MAG: hypothetical protein AAAFM81_00250 [Pseudomonadota bacterium]
MNNEHDQNELSVITAVLPESNADEVAEQAIVANGLSALSWKARTTLLRTNWLSRWMPPVTPVRSVMQMIVPTPAAKPTLASLIRSARLHQQVTGAVFSTPCARSFVGSKFVGWSEKSLSAPHELASIAKPMTAIFCVVGPDLSDHVARAAVAAGAHGPVISIAEGRGLRDRIGWLRITKEHRQDVQLVLAEHSVAGGVFNAMARAGQFDKPGRGLIYSIPVDAGVFNLASEYASTKQTASLQQIIDAIDSLAGHSHWREHEGAIQSIASPTYLGSGHASDMPERQCLTAVVRHAQAHDLNELILDCGASGMNTTQAHLVSASEDEHVGDARIHEEYALIRSVVSPDVGEQLFSVLEQGAEELGFEDVCVATNPIDHLVAYVPGKKDYRSVA